MRIDSLGHKTRYSDSSLYDEKCVRCGGTDGRGDGSLNHRCSGADAVRKKAMAFLASRCSFEHKEMTWGDWLLLVMKTFYNQDEGFNGKRPTGNSGWRFSLNADMKAFGVDFDDVMDALRNMLANPVAVATTLVPKTTVIPKTADMRIGDALDALKRGEKVARKGWNDKGMWLVRVTRWSGNVGAMPPDYEYAPFIVLKTADNTLVPWDASQADSEAMDWQVIA